MKLKEEKGSKLKIFPKNFKGQVTIFIIIAILVIALGVLIYMFYPKLISSGESETKSPSAYIYDCMKEEIEEVVENVSLQGGSVNPDFYYLYREQDGKKYAVEYLCYTEENYKFCTVYQPLLIPHMEAEIKREILDEVRVCFSSLKNSYERKGYSVEMQEGDTNVALLPNNLIVKFDYNLTMTRGDTERYQNFEVRLDSSIYKMANIALGIIYWETKEGDCPVDILMDLYDLRIEKQLQLDGTRIYIISEFENEEEKFQFASRSLVRPSGVTL